MTQTTDANGAAHARFAADMLEAAGHAERLAVTLRGGKPDPEIVRLRAEVARLRAENERLRAVESSS